MRFESSCVVNILASPHVVCFAPGPPGDRLICAGNGLWLCDLAGKVLHTFRKPSRYGVSNIFVTTKKQLVAKTAAVIRVWSLTSLKLETELEPKALGYHVLASVSRDGARALTTTRNKSFTVWDLARQSEVVTFSEKKSFVAAAALSVDGRLVAYGGTDGALRLFDVASGAPLSRSEAHGWIEVVTRSDDGRYFASAGRAGVVSIWKTDGALHRSLRQGGTITALAFAPDARFIVAHGSHGAPVMWDVESGERSATLDDRESKGLLGGTRSVRFSADGKRVVTMGNDCRAVVSKIV